MKECYRITTLSHNMSNEPQRNDPTEEASYFVRYIHTVRALIRSNCGGTIILFVGSPIIILQMYVKCVTEVLYISISTVFSGKMLFVG